MLQTVLGLEAKQIAAAVLVSGVLVSGSLVIGSLVGPAGRERVAVTS